MTSSTAISKHSSFEQPPDIAITPNARSNSTNGQDFNDGNLQSEPSTGEKNVKNEQIGEATQSKSPASRSQQSIQMLIWIARDQWFLIAMAALILISSQVQVPDDQQQIKRTVITYLSVSVIFFINGCTFPTRTLVENYRKWKIHLFVQAQSYLVTSAATFAIVSLCATNTNFMDAWLLIGYLFLGSGPTTMSSNVIMTRQAHGNPALTVVQSIIGQCLCPFLSPILIQMYLSSGAWYAKVLINDSSSNYAEIYRRVFMQLGISLFIPIAIGQVIQYFFPTITKKVFFEWKLLKLSSIALLTLIWQTFDQAFRSGAFDSIKTSNKLFIVFISIALYFFWTGICLTTAMVWLPRRDVIACCYCTPAKALGMIVPLSSVMYIDITPTELSKIQIPAIIFQVFQVGIGSLCTIVFRRWMKPLEEKEALEKNGEASFPA
ncbi:hypothetical protein DM02DRAFT_589728 [Periconia macrospinosa]|uniref:Sodium bile acid symporter family protein n=1 Tax=Periconia macrospinosa TaxID=97972 RepID=A0A2V1DW02_9PLEO|nr:hypothetical protein DM02DRAFT_589728 [Periconia macrospinosa]